MFDLKHRLCMPAGGGGGDQTPAPTEQERALAKVGAEQWNDYATRYAGPGGVNEKFIQSTRATEGDKLAAGGQVAADAAQAGRAVKQSEKQAGLARGVGSSSGATIAGMSGTSTELASTEGRAKGMAVQSAEDVQLAADFKLASFGRGLEDVSRLGLQQGTARATRLVNRKAEEKFKSSQALLQAAGTGLGMYAQTKDLFGKKPKVKTKAATKSSTPLHDQTSDLGW